MNQKILTVLASKYNLDEEVIERVIRSQFEFVRDTMEQGEFQAIRLHHLGVFGVKPRRVENYIKNKNDRQSI